MFLLYRSINRHIELVRYQPNIGLGARLPNETGGYSWSRTHPDFDPISNSLSAKADCRESLQTRVNRDNQVCRGRGRGMDRRRST